MPPEQILSSFPPANAEGAFGDRLPQIVLKRRTLPWERNPAGEPEVVADALAGARRGRRRRGRAVDGDTRRPVRHRRHGAARPRRQGRRAGPVPRRHRDRRPEDLPVRAGPAVPDARAPRRHPRHRTGQRRRRRLAGRRAGQPAAGVRHRQQQAGPLHGLPRQPRGPARRAAAAPAGRRLLRVRAGAGLDRATDGRAGPGRPAGDGHGRPSSSPVAFPLDDGAPRAAAPHASGPIGRAKSAITGARRSTARRR